MQRVRAKMFIVSTVLLPLVMSLFAIVPAIILSIETPPLRIAVLDQTGKMFAQVKQALSGVETDQGTTTPAQNDNTDQRGNFGWRGDFVLEEVSATNQSAEQIRDTLDQRLNDKELDGYIILPPDFLNDGKAEFFTRNAGDLVSHGRLVSALNRAVRQQRLIDANVDTRTRQELFKPAQLQAVRIGAGTRERDSGERFALVFGVGLVMYIAILMYGQIILGAVIEEKETRIAEILFSSVKPFTLMMGKLVGVSLVALTQFAIWGLAFSAFALYGAECARGKWRQRKHSQRSAFTLHLLRTFLSARLFYLRDDLCVGRIDGDNCAGRRAVGSTDHSDPRCQLLLVLPGEPQP